MFARLGAWFRWRRHKAHMRRLGRGDPVRAAIEELCIQADERGIDELRPAQRNVVLAWAARGIIGNGGFQYYYEGAWTMAAVAGAFRTLGFAEAATACERSMSIFPGAVPPQDGQRRLAALRRANLDALGGEEAKVFAVSWEALREAIGTYMVRFRSEFPMLRR